MIRVRRIRVKALLQLGHQHILIDLALSGHFVQNHLELLILVHVPTKLTFKETYIHWEDWFF